MTTLSMATPNVVFATPVTFSNSSGAWTGTMSLNTQSANTFFGNGTGSTATPTFMSASTARTALALVPGTDVFKQRTMTGTSNEITVANGDGSSANPTFSLPSSLTFTGKTITGGTYATITLSGHPTIEGVTSTGATGTNKHVYDTSPVLVTPNIGAATGTSLSVSGSLTAANCLLQPAAMRG